MSKKTVETIHALNDKLTDLVRAAHETHMAVKPGKDEPRYYTMKDAARLIGRTYPAIRNAEIHGHIPNPVTDGQPRERGYSLAEINRAREHFGTRLQRAESDPPVILGFSNFKGGSGKTTSSVHFAQYAAESGLRVLLVDVDPQASATTMFGYIPDEDIDQDETIQGYMEEDAADLYGVIRQTYWDGLDLIPSNLSVYNTEYLLAGNPSSEVLYRLKRGLDAVAQDYDVVVIDPPPALGMISMSVMHAATALIIPTPAAITDLFSTKAFGAMLVQVVETLDRHGYNIDYDFVRLLVTRLDENSETQTQMLAALPDLMGSSMLTNAVRRTAAMDRAAAKGRTLYEVTSRDVSSKVLKRGLLHMNRTNDEILTLIRETWPTHSDALRESGN